MAVEKTSTRSRAHKISNICKSLTLTAALACAAAFGLPCTAEAGVTYSARLPFTGTQFGTGAVSTGKGYIGSYDISLFGGVNCATAVYFYNTLTPTLDVTPPIWQVVLFPDKGKTYSPATPVGSGTLSFIATLPPGMSSAGCGGAYLYMNIN